MGRLFATLYDWRGWLFWGEGKGFELGTVFAVERGRWNGAMLGWVRTLFFFLSFYLVSLHISFVEREGKRKTVYNEHTHYTLSINQVPPFFFSINRT